MGRIRISGRFVGDAYMRPVLLTRYIALPGWLQRAVNDRPYTGTWGNTAQFPPDGLSTAPAAAAQHLRCQNARQYTKYCLRFWLSGCRTSLAVSALRIMRYCPRNYHFPLASRPPSRITENIAAKNRNVSQIGLNTHNQDHEISPVIFSRTKIIVKAMIGSLPDRLFLFSVCIIIPPNLQNHPTAICRVIPPPKTVIYSLPSPQWWSGRQIRTRRFSRSA